MASPHSKSPPPAICFPDLASIAAGQLLPASGQPSEHGVGAGLQERRGAGTLQARTTAAVRIQKYVAAINHCPWPACEDVTHVDRGVTSLDRPSL